MLFDNLQRQTHHPQEPKQLCLFSLFFPIQCDMKIFYALNNLCMHVCWRRSSYWMIMDAVKKPDTESNQHTLLFIPASLIKLIRRLSTVHLYLRSAQPFWQRKCEHVVPYSTGKPLLFFICIGILKNYTPIRHHHLFTFTFQTEKPIKHNQHSLLVWHHV
jgi:hypothetical protein